MPVMTPPERRRGPFFCPFGRGLATLLERQARLSPSARSPAGRHSHASRPCRPSGRDRPFPAPRTRPGLPGGSARGTGRASP